MRLTALLLAASLVLGCSNSSNPPPADTGVDRRAADSRLDAPAPDRYVTDTVATSDRPKADRPRADAATADRPTAKADKPTKADQPTSVDKPVTKPDGINPCRPYCGAIGSKSEGWYDGCTKALIGWDSCATCTAECKFVGTYSQGWYSSCTAKLIVWDVTCVP